MNKKHPSAWDPAIMLLKYFSFCDWFNHWSRVNCQIGNQYKYIHHRCTVCNYYCQNSVEDIPEI